METGATQNEVVQAVLTEIQASKHLHATVYLDRELDYMTEDLALGITNYKSTLKNVLANTPLVKLPHEEIIRKLDEAGKSFHVLVLKTNLTLPYTSVFFQLGCGYWNDKSETKLRSLIPHS